MNVNIITIFLDIDGVLATVKQYNLSNNSKTWIKQYNCYPFDEKCVKTFNKILKKFNCEIVLTSDWRLYYKQHELEDIFKINGVIQTPVNITTKETFYKSAYDLEIDRAEQIKKYIVDNKINNYIVIDDLNMEEWFNENFFYCTSEFEGIKKSGLLDKIINKLNEYD